MNYEESLSYLLSLGNEVSAMKLTLENIRILLASLRRPEKNYLKVQIAGTNGKGSTCAFLEAICLAAGIRTGLNTSPHLVSVTERIRINGREISERDFARQATLIRKISEKLVEENRLEAVPTFFEQITAIALNAFADARIELAILETGLGGRLDAATAADAEIVGITPIDFDHQRILGGTLEKIAAEKAAIIRKNTKVVVAEQPKEALRVILERCADCGVTPQNAALTAAKILGKDNQKYIVDFQTEQENYKNVRPNLLGRHQIENAAAAVLLAETLKRDFKISTENIIEGLETAKHKGRLEFYKNFLFDGAHNAAGAKALRNFFDEFVEKPVTMIFGSMRDKDLTEISQILFPKVEKLILTPVDNERSLKAEELSEFIPKDFDRNKVKLAADAREALAIARKISSSDDLICVTGSLYLVGEARKFLKI